MQFLLACRTPAMGQHLRACPHGHVQRIFNNSCRHRACPQCGRRKLATWIEDRTRQFLACDHYHVTFTVPVELHPLWHRNRRRMNAILFDCARATLFELLADPKYLGARPGILAALHTWGRTLTFHPHVHTLVTGGGWDGETWRSVTNGYLLPIRVVSALFRGKMLAAIRHDLAIGELQLPDDRSPTLWANLFRKLYEQRWNVNIQERYPHTRGILHYLGRYLRGGPIGNRRLVALDDRRVRLRYTDHRDQKSKILDLSHETFLQRICWHVPEPGQHQVRLWGLYARAKSEALEEARQALALLDPQEPSSPVAVPRLPPTAENTCPVCGMPLVFIADLPSFTTNRAPPIQAA